MEHLFVFSKQPRHFCYSPGRPARPDLHGRSDSLPATTLSFFDLRLSPSSAPAGIYEKKFKSSSFSMVPAPGI